VILAATIGATASSNRTIEGFIVVGMHLTGRTDGGERMFGFDRLDSRSALGTFDLDGNLQPLTPDFKMPILGRHFLIFESHTCQFPEFLGIASFSITEPPHKLTLALPTANWS
jgi:hypothetical protein